MLPIINLFRRRKRTEIAKHTLHRTTLSKGLHNNTRLCKQKRFKFMNDEIGQKAIVINILSECLFQMRNFLIWRAIRKRRHSWKISRQTVVVNERRYQSSARITK